MDIDNPSVQQPLKKASLKIGDPFNPHRAFIGVFVPLRLLAYNGLSDAAKLLYGRLCMFAGKDGECFPSLDRLGQEFERNPKVVSRWMTELVEQGFIRRTRRGPGKNALVKFIWHRALSAENDSTKTWNQEDELIPQKCTLDSTKMRSLDSTKTWIPYKEQEIQVKETHSRDSSSSEESPVLEGGAVTAASSTTTNPSLRTENPKLETPAWWSPEEFREARESIRDHRCPTGPLPDAEITTSVMSQFRSLDEFTSWLDSLIPGWEVRSFGFYPVDASKRAESIREHTVELRERAAERRKRQAAEAEAAERLRQEEQEREACLTAIHQKCLERGWRQVYALQCLRCAGFGRNPDNRDFCTCDAGVKAGRCDACGSRGWTRGGGPATYAWCRCIHAERLRVEHGEQWIETMNEKALADRQERQLERDMNAQVDRWVRVNKGAQPSRGTPAFRALTARFLHANFEEREAILLRCEGGEVEALAMQVFRETLDAKGSVAV